MWVVSGVHLVLGYALIVGFCIPILFYFWGFFIFISLSPTFILSLTVKLDVQGAFSMEGFFIRTEGDWLGVVNRCKVTGHRSSSFYPVQSGFGSMGILNF